MSAPRLELDFIAAPRHARWPGLLLLAAAVAAAANLALRYRDAREALPALQAGRSALEAARRPPPALPAQQARAEAKRAESVLRQLALPWASMIEAVEQASSTDVTLLQMQPDAEHRSLRLTAEARSLDAMLVYLRRLDASRLLSAVHLVSHRVLAEDPSRPVRFVVQAALRERA